MFENGRIINSKTMIINNIKLLPFYIAFFEKGKYILQNGDILFARTGATVGKSYLIKGLIPESIFASYLIRLKLSKLVNKLNIFYFCQDLIDILNFQVDLVFCHFSIP